MKKLIALLLALVLVMGLFACGQKEPEEIEIPEEPETEGAASVVGPETALELLETVWNLFEEKFPTFGGDGLNMIADAPGAYTDMEALNAQLLVPAEEQANIEEIASLFHGMMANNFTCGAFKLADGVDAAAFAETMYNAAQNNQWMCGIPEKVMVAVVGDCVVMVFGLADVVDTFQAKLTEAYAFAEVKYSEAIA